MELALTVLADSSFELCKEYYGTLFTSSREDDKVKAGYFKASIIDKDVRDAQGHRA